MKQRTVVVAGSYREFQEWCRENGRSRFDPCLIYAKNANQVARALMGTRGAHYVLTGTCWERRDWDEIRRELLAREAVCAE